MARAFRDLASQRSQPSTAIPSDASAFQPLKRRMDQIEASIKRMTDAFQSTLRQTREESEPSAMQQRMDRMENSMGDMKGMVGRVLQALAGLNAAASLGLPTI